MASESAYSSRPPAPRAIPALLALALAALATGCATTKKLLALDGADTKSVQGPIHNPFGTYYSGKADAGQNVVLRTKKGDRSVELELPKSSADQTDFVIPMSPAFAESARDARRSPAGGTDAAYVDNSYSERQPGISDREFAQSMPKGSVQDDDQRRGIEKELGLMAADEPTPEHDQSYLAKLDLVKQLYRIGRYEAALLELDDVLRVYQTDPTLYKMRGTLLERLGRQELAVKSWNQALRLNPGDAVLKKFLDRRRPASVR